MAQTHRLRHVFARVFVPAAAVVAVEAANEKKCKRTELPIYVSEPAATQSKVGGKSSAEVCDDHPSNFIEENIRLVRKNISSAFNEVRTLEDEGKKLINHGVEQVHWFVNYLGDADNPAPKIPAIVIGGLTGFILALRGGKFKKLVFTTAGAVTMASLCYPKEAKEYGTLMVKNGKVYATIAYNFAYGVKKGDPPRELPSLPKLPSSLTEVWSLASGLFNDSTQPQNISDNCTKEAEEVSTTENEDLYESFLPDVEVLIPEDCDLSDLEEIPDEETLDGEIPVNEECDGCCGDCQKKEEISRITFTQEDFDACETQPAPPPPPVPTECPPPICVHTPCCP